ncbi:MAG: DegV family protein [Solobacterium sp.]|nr:DegV family protein [Solobacterium sp.]
MNRNYVILTDATADSIGEIVSQYDFLDMLPMPVSIAGKEYLFGGYQSEITCQEFYELERQGNYAQTSQIPPNIYFDYFRKYLDQGFDVLYLCFTSGLSGTYQTALMCAKQVAEKYPEQRLTVIDSAAASIGQGFLVREALLKKQEGYSYEELINWVEEYKLKVVHCFTVDVLNHLEHGGRISQGAAIIGTTLQVKPLLRVDENGKLEVVAKPRGNKKAMHLQVQKMEEGWRKDISPHVLIGHGDDYERVLELKNRILDKFPDAEIEIAEINPIIGCHTGPGMLALAFWGDNR